MATTNQSSSDEAKVISETLIPELPVDEDIHLLNGFCYPKSRTTWLKALLFSIVNRATYNHDDMMHPLLNSTPHELLFACRIVYVFRDPKDFFVSLWHFLNKLRPKRLVFHFSPRGFQPIHVTGYYKASIQFPNKVFFVRYEDLKTEAVFHVKRLAEFVGWPFSEEEENEGVVQKITDLCSFDKLSNLEVNKNGSFIRKLSPGRTEKGEIGDFKNHLSEEMSEILDKITEDKFNEVGLKTFVSLVKTD
nr:flavonol sulfotransferase-like [Ipomoea batatas]